MLRIFLYTQKFLTYSQKIRHQRHSTDWKDATVSRKNIEVYGEIVLQRLLLHYQIWKSPQT